MSLVHDERTRCTEVGGGTMLVSRLLQNLCGLRQVCVVFFVVSRVLRSMRVELLNCRCSLVGSAAEGDRCL